MSLVDHLQELRKRLIITLTAFLLFFSTGMAFVKHIYKWFIRDLDMKLAVLGPSDVIWIYFKLASVVAIALTIPILAFQLWSFVKPALTIKERKVTLSYIPALFILFLVGLVFGYFVVRPLILNFLMSLSRGMFTNMYTVDKYFGFIFRITLPFALLFELPLIVMFLTSLGIISPSFLKRMRKVAYLLLAIV